MLELHFSLWVPTILSTLLAYTNIDTVVKTANDEGEPSDKVLQRVSVSSEMGEKSDRQTKKQYANTAGLELIHMALQSSIV